MAQKIDVKSGDPYRDPNGHFGTSPAQKLAEALASAADKKLVPHDDNKKKIDSYKKEAAAKLAVLREGKEDVAVAEPTKIGEHEILGHRQDGKAIDSNGDIEMGGGWWFSASTGQMYSDNDKPTQPDSGSTADELLKSYTGDYNLYVNDTLRKAKGDDKKLNKEDAADIKVIDQQMKDPVKSKYLYRGTHANLGGIKVGSTFTDHGYGSTSKSKQVGEDYADPEGDQLAGAHDASKRTGKDFQSYVFKITPKKDMKAIDTQKHGWEANEGEKEVILPRGTTYKVNKITKSIAAKNPVDVPYSYTLVEVEIL